MDDPEQTPDLVDRFGQQPPEVMAELRNMLVLYGVDAQELFFKWESYCIKMLPEEVKMTLDSVRAFKESVQSILEKEMRGKARMQHQAAPTTTMRTPRPRDSGDVYGM
jgi:DNA polymerase alpha subunit B